MIHIREKIVSRQNLENRLDQLPITDADRVDVLLAAEGLKRATELEIISEQEVGDIHAPVLSRGEMDRTAKRVSQILRTMGLATVNPHVEQTVQSAQEYMLYAAGKREDAERLAQLFPIKTKHDEHSKELGNLYGFPQTAIEAYSIASEPELENRFLVNMLELFSEVENEEFAAFLNFRLSKEHWREELNTVRVWAETVKRRAPQLYTRRVKSYRERLARYDQGQKPQL